MKYYRVSDSEFYTVVEATSEIEALETARLIFSEQYKHRRGRRKQPKAIPCDNESLFQFRFAGGRVCKRKGKRTVPA